MAVAPPRSRALPVAIVLSLVLSGMGGVAAAAAPQPTAVSSCTTITSPGQYVLTTDIENSGASACLSIRANGVTLDGGGHTVDGVDATGTYGVLVGGSGSISDVTVRNVVTTDWGTGIHYSGATDGEVASVTSNSNHLAGIRLVDTTNTLIRGSTVASNGAGFREVYGNGVLVNRGSGNEIRNVVAESNNVDGVRIRNSSRNSVRDVVSTNNHRHGIMIEDESHDNTVTSSTFDANDRDGMTIRRDSNRNELVGNTANDNGHDSNDGDGVEILGSDDNLVEGNAMRNNPDDGIVINHGGQGNRIVDNAVTGNAKTGVLVRIDSSDNRIARNRIAGHPTGIYVEGSADDPNTNRTAVVSNRIVDSDQYGIRLENGGNHTVVMNTVRESGAGGILLSETTGTVLRSNRAVANDADGIVLASARDNRLGNNSLVGNGRYGVTLAGSDGNVLEVNRMWRNGAGGVELVSSDDNRVITSDVRANGGDGIDVLDSDDNRIARNTFVDNRDLSVFVHGDSSGNSLRDNGGQADPAEYDPSDLTIEGSGDWSGYRFTTDGRVVNGSRLESYDSIDDASLSGGVSAGVDQYRFAGGYTELVVNGDATVRVDGRRLHARAFA